MGNCFVLTAEEKEIVAVMDGQCGVQRVTRRLRRGQGVI
jgi:hypothetical protein